MSQRLHGSVCLITGASAGIGKACALTLAREGACLVLIARRKQPLDELVGMIQSSGGELWRWSGMFGRKKPLGGPF